MAIIAKQIFWPYGAEVVGHDERGGQHRPQSHLGLRLIVTEREIANYELEWDIKDVNILHPFHHELIRSERTCSRMAVLNFWRYKISWALWYKNHLSISYHIWIIPLPGASKLSKLILVIPVVVNYVKNIIIWILYITIIPPEIAALGNGWIIGYFVTPICWPWTWIHNWPARLI